MYRKINTDDYIGKRFGRLIITGRSLIGGKKGKGSIWDCVCDCGNKVQVLSGHLWGKYRGKTRSCGCLHDENSRRHRPPGETGLIKVMRHYQEGAKRRGLSFNLTLEDFRNLTSKNCTYCGSPPSRRSIVNTCLTDFSTYYYTGLDRIDPSQGYHIHNVAPCCFSCNAMKLNLTHEEFLNRISIIYHRHQKEIEQRMETDPNHPLFQHDRSKPFLEISLEETKGKSDSIFYAFKNIARLRYLKKDYLLTTSGAYRFIYKDEKGKRHHGNDISSVLRKWTDSDIQRLRSEGSIRQWGIFIIIVWTPTPEDKSLMETHPAGNTYGEAMHNFKNFLKENIGIDTLEERYRTQRNYARKIILKGGI